MSDDNLDQIWDLRYRIGYSIRYHRDRERVLDMLDKSAKAIAVIGGAATISKVIDRVEDLQLWVGATISITSMLSLVFSLSQRARLHYDLARRLGDLDAKIVACEPTPDLMRVFEAEYAGIQRDEPPVLALLVQDCQNREALARGCPEAVHPITGSKRFFMHLFSFSGQLKASDPGTPTRPDVSR